MILIYYTCQLCSCTAPYGYTDFDFSGQRGLKRRPMQTTRYQAELLAQFTSCREPGRVAIEMSKSK